VRSGKVRKGGKIFTLSMMVLHTMDRDEGESLFVDKPSKRMCSSEVLTYLFDNKHVFEVKLAKPVGKYNWQLLLTDRAKEFLEGYPLLHALETLRVKYNLFQPGRFIRFLNKGELCEALVSRNSTIRELARKRVEELEGNLPFTE